MSHLCLPFEEGGLNLLDLEARNDAIDITWLRAYLALGSRRPLWASVADALFARLVPKDCSVRPEMRFNMFLQHWRPKLSALPTELKAMVKVADKYNLRVEGLAFARTILREMPIWDHGQAEVRAIRRLAIPAAVVTCLYKNHGVRTVGDCERLASSLQSIGHCASSGCTCDACEHMITEKRCSNPHRCYERAERLLGALPPKWDPRGEHPEDYEEEQANSHMTAGVEDAQLFDRRVTTTGALSTVFRIFTDNNPVCNERLDMKLPGADPLEITIATDGACLNNGERNACAGAGVYVEDNHPLNMSMRLPLTIHQSNQTGEAVATLLATRKPD
ncbi:hypothetical protein C2E23DRAFT_718170, partial [Lenzites betulinus]